MREGLSRSQTEVNMVHYVAEEDKNGIRNRKRFRELAKMV